MPARAPSDAAARAAALDPGRSFVVQAPAGSGKTELLTDRILALLATVQRPEEVVAITFTRKAASEMHARVMKKLRDGAGPRPESGEEHKLRSWELARQVMQRDAELRWDLLRYPARLAIRTIDSFCAWLVRSMPWSSALGGMPAICDDAREHYAAAARATLAMADDDDSVRRFLAHMDIDLRAAQDLIGGMLGNRDQWLPLLGQGADAQTLLAHLEDAIEEDLRGLLACMPAGWAQQLAPSVVPAASNTVPPQSGMLDLAVLEDWDSRPFDACMRDLPKWQALARLLLTATGGLRRTVNKNQGFPPKSAHKEPFLQWLQSHDENEPWVERLAAIRGVPGQGYDAQQIETLQALIAVLWLACAQLNLRFAQTGEVDFIEISQRALQALGQADDPGELLLRLDASIRHLLIDEFQDTSQSQIDLLGRLTAGWEPGDGRTLFLVGDPMQSIYRFRKAEVGWFLKVQEEGLGGIALESLRLTDNFRSQAGVVDWVNRVFGPMFPALPDAAMGAIPYTPSAAFNEALPGPAMQFHPVVAGDDAAAPGAGAHAQAEDEEDEAAGRPDEDSEAIAVRLAREALERDPDSPAPVAVLVRARSHLGSLVRRLGEAGIPCRAVELVPLASRQVVSDLVQLARALAHPGDRLAWLSVLRAPMCGLKLASLHALFGDDHGRAPAALLEQWLRRDAQGDPGLDADEAARLRLAARVLLDGGNRSGAMPFAAWLEDCWRRLGGPAAYPGAGDRADVESVLRLIEALAPYGGLDPAELDRQLQQLYAAPNGAGRAVEVMTIHKSKGLEFGTVILMGLHRRPRGDTAPLIRLEQSEGRLLLGPIRGRASEQSDPVSSYLAEREKKRAAHETDRLLYVAATRARERLHLIATVTPGEEGVKKPAAASLLGRLWDQLEMPQLPPRLEEPSAAPALPAAAPPRRLLRLRQVGPAQQFVAAAGESEAAGEFNAAGGPAAGAPAADIPVAGIPVAGTPVAGIRGASAPAADISAAGAVAAPDGTPGGGTSAGVAPGRRGGSGAWVWPAESGYESMAGTVAHAWLERLGRDGLSQWPPARVEASLGLIRRQLSRAGVAEADLAEAARAVGETLQATLASERGRWLLEAAGAHREWSLLDVSGRVSVIDLAISHEGGWLVVDYKTGVPHEGESLEAYAERMAGRYAEQIRRYSRQVEALDGRPARGALYFPRADLWVDC
ncbi:UvrD-helicase domain-containing protein [Candidimonas humi]|uniref:DNA 3'-5' helicase n=1 Tax=Candidimonas humi TaxID=683355 RepID=A0ABV8NZT6_9BURK|nr:UvrD-helicase domain-containing protein [Candidimonas humi]MBV6306834.1 UvrD-helicase domain-containing protein [Candidimonas humi]